MYDNEKLTFEELLKIVESSCEKRMHNIYFYNSSTKETKTITLFDILDIINRQKEENKKFEMQKILIKPEHNFNKKKLRKLLNQPGIIIPMAQEKIEFIPSKRDIEIQAFEKFAEAYKNQIKNYTGVFTDEDFYVSLRACLSAIDFIKFKLVGEDK